MVAISTMALVTIPIEDWANERCQQTGEHCGTPQVVASIRTALVVALGIRAAAPAIPALTSLAERGAGAGGAPSLLAQITGVPYP